MLLLLHNLQWLRCHQVSLMRLCIVLEGILTRIPNAVPSFGVPNQGASLSNFVMHPSPPMPVSNIQYPSPFHSTKYPMVQPQTPVYPDFSNVSLFPSNQFPIVHHQPQFYLGLSNAYGFVGNTNAQRQYSNSNTGTRHVYGTKPNGNGTFRSSSYGGNHGNTLGGRQNGGNWQSWSGNIETRPNIVPECQICSKMGHTTPNCWKRSTNPSSSGSILECQICGKRGHSALDCHHRNNFAYQGSASAPTLTAIQAQAPANFLPNDSWIIDTGASHYMTADLHSLQQVYPYEGNDKITIGNGEGQGNQGCNIPWKEQ
ncbi:uncharacterized protein LOC126609681 [Malus sylvestris]|uniref:uncharacterized protein LOC126609681 n=1 Tax=Malus sylvestris TaxID=3752 RepID=UPI0021ACBA6A|nr:uncharacterized protein LOC126609681 [Malus sylvestris]